MSNGKRATIQDVARRANVSPATVSRALRGDAHGLVKEANRQRILAVAAELNYRHNAAASNLRRGKSNVIALVVAETETPYPIFWRKVNAASRVLREAGYSVLFYHCGSNLKAEQETLKQLRSSQADGVLIAC